MVLLTSWMLWKHSNDCTFEGATACVAVLLRQMREEAKLWARTGALGLRRVYQERGMPH
jgi:hypothetical protein